jgi:hypothetical protein
MIFRTSLIALALLATLFAGCSKHSPAAASPKVTNLGVVEVSDGIPSRHVLADGRACDMTPTILKDGRIKLVMSIGDTNASGGRLTYSLATVFSADQATLFAFDKDNEINLTLHISK